MAVDRRRIGYVSVVAGYVVTMLGSTLPTPLYPAYRQAFGLSAFVLTAVFAAYALSVLLSLLALGSLSDRVGRRPVLIAAVVAAAASAITFAFADSLAALFLGRVLSGVAVGLYVSTASPALLELAPGAGSRRPAVVSVVANVLGLGLGPLVAGILAQYAPDPMRLAFLVQVGLAVLAAAALRVIPEPSRPRVPGGAAGRRPTLPPAGWPVFWRAAAPVVGAFAMMGLYTALAPTLLVETIHVANTAVVGAVVFVVFAASGVGQLFLRDVSDRRAVVAGGTLLAAGVALVAVAASTGSLAAFVIAAVGGGLGQGLAYMGSLSMLARQAPEEHRAAVLSGYFVAGYAGVALPVLGLSLLTAPLGLPGATVTFAAAIATLAALVAADALRASWPGAPA
jgi:MFS family permease